LPPIIEKILQEIFSFCRNNRTKGEEEMKKEYIKYAERLNTIGDLIIAISNLIRTPERVQSLSKEEILDNKKELLTSVERFEYAKESLSEIKAPFVVQNQHNKLVEQFGKFIESIRILEGSLSVNDVNKNEYIRGFALQKESVKAIGEITKIIGDKLLR
jgi:hypothetical protein